ncbi:MAG: hypothetical protein RIF32_09945 [Leptospirales bacterium]|jgi:hypothetical protein
MRKLFFTLPLLFALTLQLTNCTAGDETTPQQDQDFDEQVLHAFLFSSGLLGPNGIVWNGAATIEECSGNTTDTLLACPLLINKGEEVLANTLNNNLNFSLGVSSTGVTGRLYLVSPHYNSGFFPYELQVAGSYQPGAGYQTNIVSLAQTGETPLIGTLSGFGLRLTSFRAEERPTGIKGQLTVEITSGITTGTGTLIYNFDSEQVL